MATIHQVINIVADDGAEFSALVDRATAWAAQVGLLDVVASWEQNDQALTICIETNTMPFTLDG